MDRFSGLEIRILPVYHGDPDAGEGKNEHDERARHPGGEAAGTGKRVLKGKGDSVMV
jgi:hypothetical protein